MKKKEVLVIFLLAALVTVGSVFKEGIIKYFCSYPFMDFLKTPAAFCRGFPVGFNPKLVLNQEIVWQRFSPEGIIINLLFWFLFLVGGWLVVKKLKTKK